MGITVTKIGRRFYLKGELPPMRGWGIRLEWDSAVGCWYTCKRDVAELIVRRAAGTESN